MLSKESKLNVEVMKLIKDMQHRSFSAGEGEGG